MANVCYGCADRVVGCHGECARYKAYRAEIDARLARQHVIRDNDIAFDLYHRGMGIKIRRRRNQP